MTETSTGQAQPGHPNTNVRTGTPLVYIIVLIGSALSLLLQCIGFVTPAWLVMNYNVVSLELKFSMGLWYVNYCSKGSCSTTDIDTFWDQRYEGPKQTVPHNMREYQIETVLAIIGIAITICCLSKLICCSPNGIYKNDKFVWSLILASSALSGILALTAAVKYGQDIMEAYNSVESPTPSPYMDPYSLIITGVGGVLSGLIFVTMVIETCRAVARINRDQGQDFPRQIDPSELYYLPPAPRYVFNYVRNEYEYRY